MARAVRGIVLSLVISLAGAGGASAARVVAVGDVACKQGPPHLTGACRQRDTSELALRLAPERVLIAGDLQYPDGLLADFEQSFAPTWGRLQRIIAPVPGNHEYHDLSARGYYDYFNGKSVLTGRAGDRTKGYYSFDLEHWHLIALNSNCAAVGGCDLNSPQGKWLRANLANNHSPCTLAYFHHPRFSSGMHGSDLTMRGLWSMLQTGKVDLILNGHDHNYERFAPQTADGTVAADGIREFVVGTGGKDLRAFRTVERNSEVRNSDSYGVLALTLDPSSYSWQFESIPGSAFSDYGSASCHNRNNFLLRNALVPRIEVQMEDRVRDAPKKALRTV